MGRAHGSRLLVGAFSAVSTDCIDPAAAQMGDYGSPQVMGASGEATAPRANGLGPWPTQLLNLVSIRAGRILTYLTRVHSYLPNPRVRSTRSANTSESPLTNPPSGALAQLVRQAAPCRHLLKSSHETAHGTTGTAPVQERNAAITDGWAESSGRARW